MTAGLGQGRHAGWPCRLTGFLAALVLLAGMAEPVRGADCVPAIEAQEARLALPEGLLMAIALTESGIDGRPWPWALNIGGEPAILPDAEAMRRTIAAHGGGRGGGRDDRPGPNIDVGCMQISLTWHADRFEDWRVLLEPEANVAYGAWFLRRLFERHGSWTLAVAHYHSGSLDRQRAYVCRVWRHLVAIGGAAAPEVSACAG
ncbi:MAG: lytic transglycosylase domain-containing protein [Azospirillaceae bacterium]